MLQFPFWAALVFALILQSVSAASTSSDVIGSDQIGCKRHFADSQVPENEPRRFKKKVIFWSLPITQPEPDYAKIIPDLFRALTDSYYLSKLPETTRSFLEFFRSHWKAHACDFTTSTLPDLPLILWSDNASIQAVSIDLHLNFLTQILNRRDINMAEPLWDLVEEYIHYIAARKDLKLSLKTYQDLLIGTLKCRSSQCFKALLLYRPAGLSADFAAEIWDAFVSTVVESNLNLSSSSARMFEIYYELTRQFGAFLIDPEGIKNPTFTQLIRLQPILSSVISYDAAFFSKHFQTCKKGLESASVYSWLDKFLAMDRKMHLASKDKLMKFADALFIQLKRNISELIDDCFDASLYALPQFLLMNSQLARTSIPDTLGQCMILSKYVQLNEFDFNYMNIILLIIGFKLTWADLEAHLIPLIGKIYADWDLMRGLKFLLQVVESAPESFECFKSINTNDSDNSDNKRCSPWTIPATIHPTHQNEIEYPFLFDAGRILLARHFGIPPTWTAVKSDVDEEATFKELADFMTFYMNKYIDGSKYSIVIHEQSSE